MSKKEGKDQLTSNKGTGKFKYQVFSLLPVWASSISW